MKATVYVTRRSGIADPQGTAVLRGVHDLGYTDVSSVRIDKIITLHVAGADAEQTRRDVEALCDKLLANPVMEDYEIILSEEDGDPA